MRPEADVYSYVQDLEKHLQMTSFGGMADPEWAFEGRCGHDLMLSYALLMLRPWAQISSKRRSRSRAWMPSATASA